MKAISKKKVIKWVLISVVSVIAFVIAHKLATMERSYKAIGGEMFMLLIPFFVWYVQDCKKQLKEDKNARSRTHRQR